MVKVCPISFDRKEKTRESEKLIGNVEKGLIVDDVQQQGLALNQSIGREMGRRRKCIALEKNLWAYSCQNQLRRQILNYYQ